VLGRDQGLRNDRRGSLPLMGRAGVGWGPRRGTCGEKKDRICLGNRVRGPTPPLIPPIEGECLLRPRFPQGHSRASGNLRFRSAGQNRGSRLRGNDSQCLASLHHAAPSKHLPIGGAAGGRMRRMARAVHYQVDAAARCSGRTSSFDGLRMRSSEPSLALMVSLSNHEGSRGTIESTSA